MTGLGRWTGHLDTGAFRFNPEAHGSGPPLGLRLADGCLRNPEGVAFCTPAELEAAGDLGWRGLPALLVEREGGPIGFALWLDAGGIDTPEAFRARVLRMWRQACNLDGNTCLP